MKGCTHPDALVAPKTGYIGISWDGAQLPVVLGAPQVIPYSFSQVWDPLSLAFSLSYVSLGGIVYFSIKFHSYLSSESPFQSFLVIWLQSTDCCYSKYSLKARVLKISLELIENVPVLLPCLLKWASWFLIFSSSNF